MLFNSYIFVLVFLPLVLLGWWQLRDTRGRLVFLTLASYVFYAWWDWRFLPLMLASTTVDYIAGQHISRTDDPRARKLWLVCSLSFNLAILGFFKYYGFFARSVNAAAERAGLIGFAPVLNIILPIGISFYTFNSMSYTIDIYRRIVRPAKSVLHFSAFVAMFPHLVSGPIVRYADIEDQFNDLKSRLPWQQAAAGIYFFVMGMAKKLLVADQLAPQVNAYFAAPYGVGAAAAWIGALGYTFQLYFDFSGYSDMAVGLAHLFGIQFPQNFNSPYQAVNIADFWRRWHMSLSTWLRDYLFLPLVGDKRGRGAIVSCLAVTMFLGGLWHGANWTFAVWGLYHGVLLAAYHLLRNRGLTPRSVAVSRALTFLCAVVGWVFFRAETLPKAAHILHAMVGGEGFAAPHVPLGHIAMIAAAAAISFFLPNTWELRLQPRPRYAYLLALLMLYAILLLEKESPFLYFQF